MQRRGFLARLGALITGAAIAPHVKAEPIGATVPVALDPPRIDGAFVPEYGISTMDSIARTVTSGGVNTELERQLRYQTRRHVERMERKLFAILRDSA